MKPRIEQRLQALEQRSDTENLAPDVIELVPLTADGSLPKGWKPVVLWRKPTPGPGPVSDAR